MQSRLLIHGAAAAVLVASALARAQSAPAPKPPTLTTTTTLVLLPTLVRTAAGEPVFNLRASDFRVTDNGSPQAVTVEEVEQQPLSVVILLQTGGAAARQFPNFARLGTVVDAMLGRAAGQVALVTFDSQPEEIWTIPPRREGLDDAFAHPTPGDDGAAILDAVTLALDLLDTQSAPGARRLILLLSQPQDEGSKATPADTLRRLGESNTTLYAATFSPEKTWVKDQLRGNRHENQPYHFGPDHPDLLHTFDLGTPLLMALKALQKDTPAELATLSGGEHLRFGSRKDLEDKLMQMANELPNSYLLSFRPADPSPGLHTLRVAVPGRAVTLTSRGSYWAAAPKSDPPPAN